MTGKEIIKEFEGLRLEAYLCPAGVPTIGWGHTRGVKLGDKITLEQAEQFLEEDYREALATVKYLVTIQLAEHQYSALASFVFNLGAKSLLTSTLLKKINSNNLLTAGPEFDKWVFAKGKKLNGLVRRRAAERKLFEE